MDCKVHEWEFPEGKQSIIILIMYLWKSHKNYQRCNDNQCLYKLIN